MQGGNRFSARSYAFRRLALLLFKNEGFAFKAKNKMQNEQKNGFASNRFAYWFRVAEGSYGMTISRSRLLNSLLRSQRFHQTFQQIIRMLALHRERR